MPTKLLNAKVVSPARSLAIISPAVRSLADEALKMVGIDVKFAANALYQDSRNTSPPELRAADINDAYADPGTDLIFSAIGGFNSIEILEYLDFELIREGGKPICGYSDITVLINAVHAKTGITCFYGPHYSTFGMRDGNAFTLEFAKKALVDKVSHEIRASDFWSEDNWFLDQENRSFKANDGIKSVRDGEAHGRLVGGNINAFRLLNGTPYGPDLAGRLLFLENDGLDKEITPQEFDRRLDSILMQRGGDQIAGLIIGRFKSNANMDLDTLRRIIDGKRRLGAIPIASGFDFGHTMPMVTLPIGGSARLSVREGAVSFLIEAL